MMREDLLHPFLHFGLDDLLDADALRFILKDVGIGVEAHLQSFVDDFLQTRVEAGQADVETPQTRILDEGFDDADRDAFDDRLRGKKGVRICKYLRKFLWMHTKIL